MSIWVTMKHWRCTYIAVAQNALLNWGFAGPTPLPGTAVCTGRVEPASGG